MPKEKVPSGGSTPLLGSREQNSLQFGAWQSSSKGKKAVGAHPASWKERTLATEKNAAVVMEEVNG